MKVTRGLACWALSLASQCQPQSEASPSQVAGAEARHGEVEEQCEATQQEEAEPSVDPEGRVSCCSPLCSAPCCMLSASPAVKYRASHLDLNLELTVFNIPNNCRKKALQLGFY